MLATFDVAVRNSATAAFNLASTSVFTTLFTASGGGHIPQFLSVACTNNAVNDFRLEFQDSSAGGGWTPIADVAVPPGLLYYPLVGQLGFQVGDQLRARGNNLCVALTTSPATGLTTSALAVSTDYQDLIPSASGSRRVVFLSVMCDSLSAENLSAQFTDASHSNTARAFLDGAPRPSWCNSLPGQHRPHPGRFGQSSVEVVRPQPAGGRNG